MSGDNSSEDKKTTRVAKKRAVKTVRKRAVRTASQKRTPIQKTARKRVARKVATPKTEVAEAVPERRETPPQTGERKRKAPTIIANKRTGSKAKKKQLAFIVGIMIIGIGGSAAVGFTDAGQIDVNQAIEERNERLRSGQLREGERANSIVSPQSTDVNRRPNGGLVGLGAAEPTLKPAKPATTTATSTATSTDATATSTEATAEGDEDSNQGNSIEVETSVTPTESGQTDAGEGNQTSEADTPEASQSDSPPTP